MHIVDIAMIATQVLGQVYALFKSRIPPYMSAFLSCASQVNVYIPLWL